MNNTVSKEMKEKVINQVFFSFPVVSASINIKVIACDVIAGGTLAFAMFEWCAEWFSLESNVFGYSMSKV